MKVEEKENSYQIYVNEAYYQGIDMKNKESISEYAKELVLKLRHLFGISLYGVYDMNIYVGDRIGMIIYLTRLDYEDDYFLSIDLRVMVHLHQTFYLKTPNFDYIKNASSILYSKGYYYVNLSEIENYHPYLELGEIVLKSLEEQSLNSALTIKKG